MLDISSKRQMFNKIIGEFTAKISEDFMKLSETAKSLSNDNEFSKLVDKSFRKFVEFNKELSKQIHQILDNSESVITRLERLSEEKLRYEKLYSSGILFQSETEMISLMEKAIDVVVKELEADEGFIVLTDDNLNIINIVTKNMDVESKPEAKELSTSVINKTFQNLQPQKFDDLKNEIEFSTKHSIVSLGLTSALCVPLISGKNVLGAVYIDRRNSKSHFKDSDLTFLVSFAKQIVKGIEISKEILDLEERLEEKPKQDFRELRQKFVCDELIGNSIKLFNVVNLASKVADTDASILILGENGTGKEVLARAIHLNSSRKNKPFIALNCGAIPNDLLESELFGYESGAFTGAVKTKPGRLELAEGGTIFLDEIAEMNVNLQAKLLRVIQTKEIERLGGTESRKINVRFIAATNKDLTKLISDKIFREDLYYRLKVIELKLPPLRERKEDIEELTKHFIKKYSKDKELILSDQALNILENYNWPGNIRELENVIQRAVILCTSDIIQENDLPQEIIEETNNVNIQVMAKTLSEAEDDFRRLYITKVIRKIKSKSEAARILGINRSHLHKLISQLEITE
ncbi:sigma 54-interacting transcriptional regulator [Stygiobacter electus]|uniref:Sigma 54-interacting transcriptional regulator n=1 Tax=Stygiobacter electus TaxID=3032292 RepID=A0AAE3NZN5_9BACT|nr:sigma 54-interacting transcriptional regulator [Stygiobacter electus]MDF1611669.1 sigma 54-interacting transcriptional regulator [Stygiobacter electus]